MWELGSNELLHLKGAGGERFAEFVDRLISAEAAFRSVPDSEVERQLRANIKDGGVDTATRCAFPDDRTGWFGSPTAWQYKSTDGADIDDGEWFIRLKRARRSAHVAAATPPAPCRWV